MSSSKYKSSIFIGRLLLAYAGSLTMVEAQRGKVDFNRDVRPILAENCFYCHGQDAAHRKADLRLDQREAALAEQAFIAGNAAGSEIMKRLVSEDVEEVMPPPESQDRKSTRLNSSHITPSRMPSSA